MVRGVPSVYFIKRAHRSTALFVAVVLLQARGMILIGACLAGSSWAVELINYLQCSNDLSSMTPGIARLTHIIRRAKFRASDTLRPTLPHVRRGILLTRLASIDVTRCLRILQQFHFQGGDSLCHTAAHAGLGRHDQACNPRPQRAGFFGLRSAVL